MLKTILLVGIGGASGSILRYLSNIFVARHFFHIFPLATLLVNVIGCLLIGLLAGLFEKHQISNRDLQYLFITGFCGGYTTFSAFSIESVQLIQTNTIMALVYIISSILLGLAAVWLGLYSVKFL